MTKMMLSFPEEDCLVVVGLDEKFLLQCQKQPIRLHEVVLLYSSKTKWLPSSIDSVARRIEMGGKMTTSDVSCVGLNLKPSNGHSSH